MSDDELKELQERQREDRKLIQKAADVLAEISRGPGLEDHQAEVLAALRIRLEGKPRGSLEDLLSAAGDLSGKGDLAEALGGAEKKDVSDWPEIEEKKRDWPGL
ncbi:MAG: hypothetical protein ACR2KQ_06565 [Actinomycetota bacterium]